MEVPGSSAAMIEQLYETYHKPLLHYLQRLLASRETAEDLVHETFIKALTHWHDLPDAVATRRWLYRIATNTAYDYLRRRKCVAMVSLTDRHAALFLVPDVETNLANAEPVQMALHHMPEQYRLPLLLSSAGFDHKDIAAVLGLTVAAVKVRMHRARAKFRHHYAA
jgi:RNA polymerase sigma-70 factor, ECF subfamily